MPPKVDFQAWAKVSPWAKVTPNYGTNVSHILTTISFVRLVPAVNDAIANLPGEELAPEQVCAGASPLVGSVVAVGDEVAAQVARDALAAAAAEL